MIRRGDLVTDAMQGDFGKPRPALVIQSDHFGQSETVTLLLVSGTLVDAPLLRLTIAPNADNGLQKESQIMIDKIMTVRRDKLGEPFGRIDSEQMLSVTRLLTVFLGMA